MAILTFSLKFKLTGACLVALLKLILLFIPTPNLFKSTVYLFKKSFSDIHNPLVRHFYCSSCFNDVEENEICEACPRVGQKNSYFIEIPIINQMKTLYRRPGFVNKLQYRQNRKKVNAENYEDIYDGQIYQELCQPLGLLSNPNNISFLWNTDGLSLYKSSKFQIWPFF